MNPCNTLIESNGSKWAGDANDMIELLYYRLQTYTLDPVFDGYIEVLADIDAGLNDNGWLSGERPEKYKNYTHSFSGNFYRLSGVFNVHTSNPEVISTLTRLIEENISSDDFKECKEAQEERKAKLSELSRKQREKGQQFRYQ